MYTRRPVYAGVPAPYWAPPAPFRKNFTSQLCPHARFTQQAKRGRRLLIEAVVLTEAVVGFAVRRRMVESASTVAVHGMRSCRGCLLAGPEHRLDISFSARGDAPSHDRPHGIIGQSYATPGLERHGKKDAYPWLLHHKRPGRGRHRGHGVGLRGGEPVRDRLHVLTLWRHRRNVDGLTRDRKGGAHCTSG